MWDVPTLWVIFIVTVAVMLVLDLFVFNRDHKSVSVKKALTISAVWMAVSLAFAVLISFEMGQTSAVQYIAAYVIEETMSVDNLFVFLVIFAYFNVPDEYQHKALFYGVIGAIAFRAVFVFAGAALLESFDFLMIVFGVILLYTAIKTVMKKEDPDKENKFAEKLSKRLRSSPDFDGDKFFTVRNGARVMTPLLICVIVIELSDIVFAFDSIPAALAISTDRLVVYSSNIFAVMGLRSLYFALKGTLGSLRYMKYGLGAVLAFVGIKMLIGEEYEIDVVYSLAYICIVLLVTIGASVLMGKKEKKAAGS
jgi:tellurite resistance protein TerC